MLFCSQQFLIFFVVIFTIYWVLPWARLRVYVLLIASFYFYASWNKWLAAIICMSTFMDYWVARGMESTTSPRRRQALLWLSLVANLGLLAYFKYANFFLESLEQTLNALGAAASLPLLKVILPIGISFYTFEAINYTVDVYRRRVAAERNLAHFMLFITFFPHLVAGPIVRARDFLPQIRRPKRWDWLRLQVGLQYFLVGVVKKMVIAERLAYYVDPVFASPEKYSTAAAWMAIIAYALQIYCDFSGYTDMALGSAHMLGYKLARNFNMPYLATNVADFWHRWHISLSSWLRDYLFIPLGGSRGGAWLTLRNLLITMTLGGLWHGAAWTFVFWGFLHGMFLILHRYFRDFIEARPVLRRLLLTPAGTILRIATTFLCVCLAWVFFRATNFGEALAILNRLVVPCAGMDSPLPYASLAMLGALFLLAHFVAAAGLWRAASFRVPGLVWGFGFANVLTLALVLAPEYGTAFIYFQF